MYDAKEVSDFYNQYGMREWERMDVASYDRINFYLHMHFVKDHIGPSKKVLDAGCGAGRYSVEFAKSGSHVTLFDISQEQLNIGKEKLRESDLLAYVDEIVQGDLKDLSHFKDESFDTVVCYGAPLNYLFEHAETALQELRRVTKKGGALLVSVNSRWGVVKMQLGREDFDYTSFFGQPDYWYLHEVIGTGNLPRHELVNHPARHFFNAEELENLFHKVGFQQVVLGSSPCVTSGFRGAAANLAKDVKAWETILTLEEKAYCNRFLADNGEFLLAKGVK